MQNTYLKETLSLIIEKPAVHIHKNKELKKKNKNGRDTLPKKIQTCICTKSDIHNMPLDKRSKNKTTIYHCYAFGRNTMIYGIIITRDEGQSFNHSQA